MAEARPAYGVGSIRAIAGGAVASGEVLVIGSRIAIYDSLKPAAAGDYMDLAIRGPWYINAKTDAVLPVGAPIYWDATNNRVDVFGATATVFAGTLLEAKANGETKALVDINGGERIQGYRIPGAPQALSGAGAMNLTTYKTNWTTTGAQAGTLAAGTFVGQLKKVQLIVDGGDGTLTISAATALGFNTVTFADAGDFIEVVWNGVSWLLWDIGNDADGATAPATSTV